MINMIKADKDFYKICENHNNHNNHNNLRSIIS